MSMFIEIEPGQLTTIWNHLLPEKPDREEAAFLFADWDGAEDGMRLIVQGNRVLRKEDFSVHRGDQIELTEDCRRSVIKEAHDRNAALIEVHSHPFPWPAQFSYADYAGLSETVPHMLWRLPERPYVALVVAPSGFDGLFWTRRFENPFAIHSIVAGQEVLSPSNLSVELWK